MVWTTWLSSVETLYWRTKPISAACTQMEAVLTATSAATFTQQRTKTSNESERKAPPTSTNKLFGKCSALAKVRRGAGIIAQGHMFGEESERELAVETEQEQEQEVEFADEDRVHETYWSAATVDACICGTETWVKSVEHNGLLSLARFVNVYVTDKLHPINWGATASGPVLLTKNCFLHRLPDSRSHTQSAAARRVCDCARAESMRWWCSVVAAWGRGLGTQ